MLLASAFEGDEMKGLMMPERAIQGSGHVFRVSAQSCFYRVQLRFPSNAAFPRL